MKMPKKDLDTEGFFRSLLPQDECIVVKPMFGHAGAFVNGNMFAGTFGKQMFVKLPEELVTELMAMEGASAFSPMEGRSMRGYVVIPSAWEKSPAEARAWISTSLKWVSGMPPKKS